MDDGGRGADKAFYTIRAKLALKGFQLERIVQSGRQTYLVSKFAGWPARHLVDLDAVDRFVRQCAAGEVA